MSYPLSYNKRQTIGAAIFLFILIGLSIFIYLIANNKIALAYNNNYQPDQPIPFSHKIHAGQYKMDCRYCHTEVEQGRHATVPSLDICMNCHLTVKTDSPWIQKLTEAYQNEQPIAWQKVHLLPDFVKFNHALHFKALTSHSQTPVLSFPSSHQVRKTCTICHGPVENMETIYQHSSLSMGWCVNCHRKKEHQAPINCTTCHY